MSRAPRVALYARVSTDEQDVGMQIDELRRAAVERGWKVVVEHVDDGVSGAKRDRAALRELEWDVEQGRVDLVAVWKLDRLGRSLIHLVTLLDDWRGRGVDLVSLHDGDVDTTTPTGRLFFQLAAAFAEYERSLILERSRAGVRRAQAQGIHCGRPRVEVDVKPAVDLIQAGYGLRKASRALKVSVTTLRRRLQEGGHGHLLASVRAPA